MSAPGTLGRNGINVAAIPVLFKAARVTAHLLQNLQLLALQSGATLETSYGERWLASNAQGEGIPRAGESVVLVLCSSPYSEFVPARVGTLSALERNGSFYSFRIELGPYLAVSEQERLAEIFAEWDPQLRPREKFVARGLADEHLALAADEPETAAAWNALTQRLRAQQDYANALFARIASAPRELAPETTGELSVQVAAYQPIRPVVKLEVSQGLASLTAQQHLDGLVRAELHVESSDGFDGSLTLVADELIAAQMPIGVEPLRPPVFADQETAAPSTVAVPNRVDTRHARGATLGEPSEPGTASTTAVVIARADLRRLLRDAASLGSAAELGRRLGELAVEATPDDVELACYTAALLIDAERWDEAAQLLNRFESAELSRSALYHRFLADCAAGRTEDAGRLLTRLDFQTDEAFELLQRALALLPARTSVALGLRAVTEALDEGRSLDLFHAIRDRISEPRDVVDFADAIQYVSEFEAADLLLAHADANRPDRQLLELLVEIASRTPGNQRIGEQIIALGHVRLGANDIAGAFDLLAAAEGEVLPAQRLELVEALADALAKLPERRDDAVTLLSTEVDTALAAGILEGAAHLGTRAIGIAAGDEAAEAVARDAMERAERALGESEPLRSLLERQHEAKVASVREAVGGRKLLVFGGLEDEQTRQALRESFGFSEVRWMPSEKNKPANADAVRQMDTQKTIVAVLTDRIGHSRSTPVIKHCDTHGMPCVLARGGARAIEGALLNHDWAASSSA